MSERIGEADGFSRRIKRGRLRCGRTRRSDRNLAETNTRRPPWKTRVSCGGLFCGAGGTTRGLIDAHGYVIAGLQLWSTNVEHGRVGHLENWMSERIEEADGFSRRAKWGRLRCGRTRRSDRNLAETNTRRPPWKTRVSCGGLFCGAGGTTRGDAHGYVIAGLQLWSTNVEHGRVGHLENWMSERIEEADGFSRRAKWGRLRCGRTRRSDRNLAETNTGRPPWKTRVSCGGLFCGAGGTTRGDAHGYVIAGLQLWSTNVEHGRVGHLENWMSERIEEADGFSRRAKWGRLRCGRTRRSDRNLAETNTGSPPWKPRVSCGGLFLRSGRNDPR